MSYDRYLRNIEDTVKSVATLVDSISLCIELPLICWAIFVLYHQVKADNVTPVYVINLLISDIIQIIGRMGLLIDQRVKSKVPYWFIFSIFFLGVVASGAFMLSIALERFVLIVHPLWYRTRRGINQSVLISLVSWAGSLLITALLCIIWVYHLWGISVTVLISTLLPFPFLVFSLVATWRTLSQSASVSLPEKKRIRRILVIVLGNYVVLFLPTICVSVYDSIVRDYWIDIYYKISNMLLYISPLMDIIIYILLRKNTIPPCGGRLICFQESRETPPTQTESLHLEPLQQVSDTSV